MPKELLPIRLFHERTVDEQRIEGMGGETPKWVLEGEELARHAASLHAQLIDCAGVDHNDALSYVVDVRLKDEATAKSRRKHVVGLLTEKGSSEVVAMAGDRDLVVAVTGKDGLNGIANRLEDTAGYAQALSCIEAVSSFEPEIELSAEASTYKIKLVPGAEVYAANLFAQELDAANLTWKRCKYAPNLEVYSVQASQEQVSALADGAMAEAVFSIRPMPKYVVVLDDLSSAEPIEFEPRDEGLAYPVVGVLDSGIAKNEQLSQWLLEDRWSPYIDEDINEAHGTAVASTVVYGDALAGSDYVGSNGVLLFDAAVMPDAHKIAVEEDELVENIRRAVKLKHETVKIWNLSLSIASEVNDGAFSDFAIALDDIQDTYDVIILKSAGNHASFTRGPMSERILAGADSVRALTVGSVANNKDAHDIADIDDPSPFTRIGPGPACTIKPEVSHYGGNAHAQNGKPIATGVTVLAPDGSLGITAGTSFSTPRMAALAANVQFALADEFDPLLIKALLVHSAKFPNSCSIKDDTERVKYYGYGIPADCAGALFNTESESTLILRGTLKKGTAIDIMDFPMPQSLIRDGHYTGQITVTCVSKPMLDPSQGAEYSQSDISVLFGTYGNKFDRDTEKANILNPIGRKESQNLLNRNLYSTRAMRRNADGSFARRERMLVQQGKYSPVKKYAVDLSELRGANLATVTGDRSWYLRVVGVYRDKTEREALSTGKILEQEYCVIITIRDPMDEAPVYDEVVRGLDQNNFWQSAIRLSNDVRIRQ